MDSNINILNELKEAGSTLLIDADRKNYYFIPVDYFNGLAENILTGIFIESLPSGNPYAVPAGYFENFPEIILDKISISQVATAPIYDSTEKMPYAVPDGYFNNLAKNILQKIKAEDNNSVKQELDEIAPLLSKIPKTNVYSVPAGYFEQLNPMRGQQILQPAAKVIPIGNRARKWFTYAAAASVAAILFVGSYLLWPNHNGDLKPAVVDVQKGISQLSDADLANYLKEDNSTAIYTNQSSEEEPQSLDIKTLIENTSDEQIEQYLINNADPEEINKGI